jgi:hypothetical protein
MQHINEFKRKIIPKIENSDLRETTLEVLTALTPFKPICAHPATFLDDLLRRHGKLDLQWI